VPIAIPQIESGAIKALALLGRSRSSSLPKLPTAQEQGLAGFECYTWNAILASAGTPAAIVEKLNKAINDALADSAVFSALEKTGIDPTPGSTPASTATFVKDELAKWAPIIEASGARIEY